MSQNKGTKATMNTTPTIKKSGSTLWTSTSDKWKTISVSEDVDVESILKRNISSLKQQSQEVKKRIEAFETPVDQNLLNKIVG